MFLTSSYYEIGPVVGYGTYYLPGSQEALAAYAHIGPPIRTYCAVPRDRSQGYMGVPSRQFEPRPWP